MNDPFARFAALIARFRWIVLVLWLLILPIAGSQGAAKAAGVLRGGGFVLPGSDSADAATILSREFGASGETNAIVVLRSATLTVDDPAFRGEAAAALDRIAAIEGVRAVTSFFGTNNPSLVSQDRRTTFAIVVLPDDEITSQEKVQELREALANLTIDHDVTGPPAISLDLGAASEADLRRAEFLTIPVIIVLLLLVFRTIVSAVIPLILGACSVITAIAALYVIGSNTEISIFALNVASMLGLGLGIDFSLIIVSRYRDELAAGHAPRDALQITMATAGRSVAYSAITVILSMLVLFLMLNLMLVRSLALAVLLVATTGLLAALTLLPALLAILGRRIEWLPVLPRQKRRAAGEQGMWYRFSHAIMRRAWLWMAVSLVILIALTIPIKDLKVVGATPGALPSDIDSVEGANALTAAFGGNQLNPIQIVVSTNSQNGVWRPETLEAVAQLTAVLAADERVQSVSSITNVIPGLTPEQIRALTPETFTRDPALAGRAAQFVNLRGNSDFAIVNVVAKTDQYDDAHEQLVYDTRESLIGQVRQLRAYDVLVGGGAASFIDLRDELYGRFPFVVLVVMALIYVILLMFFQSVVLPLKAILLNLASILATYGFLVIFFGYGLGGPILAFTPINALSMVMPVILFVILLGLSTDYEVFMLSRVKEYYHETRNNEEAVAAGLESTARVITAAGLILLGTFGSFGLARVLVIKEFGIGLAFGVLLDSTLIRVIMVPASMRLMGNANWWMPAWLKKIVPELREGPAPSLPPASANPSAEWGAAPILAAANAPQLAPLYPQAGQPTGYPPATSHAPQLAPLYPAAGAPQLPPLHPQAPGPMHNAQTPGAPQFPPAMPHSGGPQLPPLNASPDSPHLPPLTPNAAAAPYPGTPQLPPLTPNVGGPPPGQQMPGAPPPPLVPGEQPAARPGAGGPPQLRPVLAGWLVPLAGSVGVERVALPQTYPFRVGRDREAEMWLFDEHISRQHARIDYLTRPAGFVVSDLGSRNGVYINGRRIAAPTLLQPGDQIAFGSESNAVFRFEAE